MECDLCRGMPLKSRVLSLVAHLTNRPVINRKTSPLIGDFYRESGVAAPLLMEITDGRAQWIGQALRASPHAVQILTRKTWGIAPTEFSPGMKRALVLKDEAMYPTPPQVANYLIARLQMGAGKHCSSAALLLWALGVRSNQFPSAQRTEMLIEDEFKALLRGSRGLWLHAIHVESDAISPDARFLLDSAGMNPLMEFPQALHTAFRSAPEFKYIVTERVPPFGQVERFPVPKYLWDTWEEKAQFLYTAYNAPAHSQLAEIADYHAQIVSAAVAFRARKVMAGGFDQPMRGVPMSKWAHHE